MAQQVKVLGILHIVLAAMTLLGGVIVFFILGGVAGLVGASASDGDAAIAIPVLAGVGAFLAGLMVFLSIPGFLAGWGLMNFRPWARVLALVLAALNLFNIPFGTALSVWAFYVLLSREGSALFEQRHSPAAPASY
jgi:hypothetical protein